MSKVKAQRHAPIDGTTESPVLVLHRMEADEMEARKQAVIATDEKQKRSYQAEANILGRRIEQLRRHLLNAGYRW
jgi:hypothetical protein